MVFYMDGVIGEMVAAIQAKEGMWENTIWVHQSDNGGPSFTGSSHTANNCEGPSLPSPTVSCQSRLTHEMWWPCFRPAEGFEDEQLAGARASLTSSKSVC